MVLKQLESSSVVFSRSAFLFFHAFDVVLLFLISPLFCYVMLCYVMSSLVCVLSVRVCNSKQLQILHSVYTAIGLVDALIHTIVGWLVLYVPCECYVPWHAATIDTTSMDVDYSTHDGFGALDASLSHC